MRLFGVLLFFSVTAHASLNRLGCVVIFPALLGVNDPELLPQRFPVREVVLNADMYAGIRPSDFAARHVPPETPRTEGYLPVSFGPRDFEYRARQFAADSMDARSVTYKSPLSDGTQIKMHLATGELLIANGRGELACFVKLPVGQRSVAGDFNTSQLFARLTGIVTAPQKYGEPIERYAQLTAGESIPFKGFPGDTHLNAHVDKHVLGIVNNTRFSNAAEKARAAKVSNGHGPEFSDLRQKFLGDIRAANQDPALEARAYANLKDAYTKRATDFMQSSRPSILTITRAEKRMVNGQERTQLLGFRFDTITNELAIFDRQTGRLITYYRVAMAPANAWLENKGYPAVNTPMEYFLSVAKIPHQE